eukprot:CAMPEP_0177362636 /NCGR_PEP_ID=MMETSP0368-20130122/37822_1 /TAXON_ID=447022 ORGANISM="Scrippsiella hangoei-like, Strain SHHI-4" /NCGR_SAMPLE_ID=MMETSP0368 /ASSEMBLY_ACC=CAM_ASM_000363 /LENGTH=41 /DNA_ID= /DNA_START= /DNA_END= /DNA_ORIENTATION=
MKAEPSACMCMGNSIAGTAITSDSTAPRHSSTANMVMANQY